MILRVRAGDSDAYAALYERHVGAAATTAARHAGNPSDTADLIADAFANVLAAIQGGHGPTVFFRAYLLTTLRRLATAKREADKRSIATDDLETVAPIEAGKDPAVAAFENEVVSRSFKTLPERWQAVLWYTEVDRMTPAAISPLLGIAPNAVSALAVRAREGLRQSYLQHHLVTVDQGCGPHSKNLGAYARGGLTRRKAATMREHLDTCLKCTAMLVHVQDVGAGMRAIIFPAVAGLGFSGAGAAAAKVAGIGAGWGIGKLLGGGSHGSKLGWGAVVATAVTGIAAVGIAMAATVGFSPFGGDNGKTTIAGAEAVAPGQPGPVSQAPAVGPTTPAPGTSKRPASTPSPWVTPGARPTPADVPSPPVIQAPIVILPEGNRPEPISPALPTAPEPAPEQTPVPTPAPSASPTATVAPSPTTTAAPTATASPSPTATPSPTQSPTPTPTPEPSETAEPSATASPSPTTDPTTTPTDPTVPESAGITMTSELVRNGLQSTTVRITLATDATGGLKNAAVTFKYPNSGLAAPATVTMPEAWKCTDATVGGSTAINCTAAADTAQSRTFELSMPLLTFLLAGYVDVDATADGVVPYSGRITLGWLS